MIDISLPLDTLPTRPSMEQLRRQAKDLLRAYREHDPAALYRVRTRLPHAATPADYALQLSEAQTVVAREYGFTGWPRLKAHIEAHLPTIDEKDKPEQDGFSHLNDHQMLPPMLEHCFNVLRSALTMQVEVAHRDRTGGTIETANFSWERPNRLRIVQHYRGREASVLVCDGRTLRFRGDGIEEQTEAPESIEEIFTVFPQGVAANQGRDVLLHTQETLIRGVTSWEDEGRDYADGYETFRFRGIAIEPGGGDVLWLDVASGLPVQLLHVENGWPQEKNRETLPSKNSVSNATLLTFRRWHVSTDIVPETFSLEAGEASTDPVVQHLLRSRAHYKSLTSFSMHIEHVDSSGAYPGTFTQSLRWRDGGCFELCVVSQRKEEDRQKNQSVPNFYADGSQVLLIAADGSHLTGELTSSSDAKAAWEVLGEPILGWLQRTASSEFLFLPPVGISVEWSPGSRTRWHRQRAREIVCHLIHENGSSVSISYFVDVNAPHLLGCEWNHQGGRGSVSYMNQRDNPELPSELGTPPA